MQHWLPSPDGVSADLTAFAPVPRKYRHDGWTAQRQRDFVAALAVTGSVTAAARQINMSTVGAYDLRRRPGAEGFRAAWAAALACGLQRLTDIAIDRAIEGVPVPVFHKPVLSACLGRQPRTAGSRSDDRRGSGEMGSGSDGGGVGSLWRAGVSLATAAANLADGPSTERPRSEANRSSACGAPNQR